MSNPDRSPDEVTCESRDDASAAVCLLPGREVPLGGPRAMTVRRSLPQRERSLIGAWCFVDHYGPDDVSVSGGMHVPGHPHTGLQTVSWLFSGEVEHRDTTGAHALVRPGELNIMTAGAGIAHSEFSTATTTTLHGVQLWVALPEAARHTAPCFEHYAPEVTTVDGARVLVFLGTLFGRTSPVSMHSQLVGAEVSLPAGTSIDVGVDPEHEHGLLCDTGRFTLTAHSTRGVAGEDRDVVTAAPGEIAFAPTGSDRLHVVAGPGEDARLLLLGGRPLGEQIVMWWNFIGRSHDEVLAFREAWQRERADSEDAGDTRFGTFPTEWDTTLPAPELPHLRLRSRG